MADSHEQELEKIARELGGGWRIEQGVMPVLVLTLPEARAVLDRVRGVGGIRASTPCPRCGGTGRIVEPYGPGSADEDHLVGRCVRRRAQQRRSGQE